MAVVRSGFATALCLLLLPNVAAALPNVIPAQPPGQTNNPSFALAPGFAPAIGNLGLAFPAWDAAGAAASRYWPADNANAPDDDPDSPAFGIGGYDPMWDDAKFSEFAAYGGLARDALRIAGLRAIDGSAGAAGAIPYGRLTLERDFEDSRHQLIFGAYGTQASVRQTAVTGFGDDSYTDVAVEGTWRWIAHPEGSTPDAIAAHVLVLHEGESLLASHAIFGTNSTDNLTVLRCGASWTFAGFAPALDYFQVAGSSDPVRLGTPVGSPASKGWIAELRYQPPEHAGLRLSLQFVSYSEFDGTTHDAAHNNTLLFHLSASTDPAA